jgi:hypothetical protein
MPPWGLFARVTIYALLGLIIYALRLISFTLVLVSAWLV